MECCRVATIGQKGLEITVLLIEYGCLCNCRLVQINEHWLKGERRKLFVTAVKSVAFKSFPSAAVNLPLTNCDIQINTRIISAGIKNSKSLWSTDALGLNIVSIVSWTDFCTGFCANMSNSELTDNASAATLMSRMKAVRKRWTRYILLLLLLVLPLAGCFIAFLFFFLLF